MIKILIHGALGRMGKNVFETACNDSECVAVCGVDRFEDFSNPNFPVYSGFFTFSAESSTVQSADSQQRSDKNQYPNKR